MQREKMKVLWMIQTESSFKIGLAPKSTCNWLHCSPFLCHLAEDSCLLLPVVPNAGAKGGTPSDQAKKAVGDLDLVGFPAVVTDSDHHRPSSCNYQSIIDPPNFLFGLVKKEILKQAFVVCHAS